VSANSDAPTRSTSPTSVAPEADAAICPKAASPTNPTGAAGAAEPDDGDIELGSPPGPGAASVPKIGSGTRTGFLPTTTSTLAMRS
jgi:hypothetical protein